MLLLKDSQINLKDFLKATREDLDLSQVKVMELTGINNKTLSGYENGVAEPDLQTLSILARLYGFSIDELLKLDKCMCLQDDEKKLIEHYRRLDIENKKQILKFISNKNNYNT